MRRHWRHRLAPRNPVARSEGLTPLPPCGGGAGGEGDERQGLGLPPSPPEPFCGRVRALDPEDTTAAPVSVRRSGRPDRYELDS